MKDRCFSFPGRKIQEVLARNRQGQSLFEWMQPQSKSELETSPSAPRGGGQDLLGHGVKAANEMTQGLQMMFTWAVRKKKCLGMRSVSRRECVWKPLMVMPGLIILPESFPGNCSFLTGIAPGPCGHSNWVGWGRGLWKPCVKSLKHIKD